MRGAWTIVTTLAVGSLAAAPAEADVATYGPFSLPSDGKSQLSSTEERIILESGDRLMVRYIAPASHCSDVRIHFSIDSTERLVSPPVKPGESTAFADLGPVKKGDPLSVRAEGVAGGCNHGALMAWGGTVVVETSGPGDVVAPLGRLIFESRSENYAWGYVNHGCTLTSAGKAFSWSVPKEGLPPPPDELTEASLVERYSHGAKTLGHLSATHAVEMERLYDDAVRAAKGPIDKTQTRYDAGEVSLVVYYFIPPDTGKRQYFRAPPPRPGYVPVILAADGDVTVTNKSPAAQVLRAWFAAASESGCTGTGRWQ
jgi:hypothetical protein